MKTKKLKLYHIIIKSHSEAPDYEEYCHARDKEDAAKCFAALMKSDWDWKDVIDHIEEVQND
jgi:hypothetical protein